METALRASHRWVGYRGEQGYLSPSVVIKILASWIDIRDYSTFSDNVNISRLRGDGT
jgi:hypothetical protein